MNPFANHVEHDLFDVNTLFTLDLHTSINYESTVSSTNS